MCRKGEIMQRVKCVGDTLERLRFGEVAVLRYDCDTEKEELLLEPITSQTVLEKDQTVLVSVGSNTYLNTIAKVEENRIQVYLQSGRAGGYIKKSDIVGKVMC